MSHQHFVLITAPSENHARVLASRMGIPLPKIDKVEDGGPSSTFLNCREFRVYTTTP